MASSATHLSPTRTQSPHVRLRPRSRRLSDEPSDRHRRNEYILSTPLRPTDRPPAQPLPHASSNASLSPCSSSNATNNSSHSTTTAPTRSIPQPPNDASSPILSDLTSPVSPSHAHAHGHANAHGQDRRAASFREDMINQPSSDVPVSNHQISCSSSKFAPPQQLHQQHHHQQALRQQSYSHIQHQHSHQPHHHAVNDIVTPINNNLLAANNTIRDSSTSLPQMSAYLHQLSSANQQQQQQQQQQASHYQPQHPHLHSNFPQNLQQPQLQRNVHQQHTQQYQYQPHQQPSHLQQHHFPHASINSVQEPQSTSSLPKMANMHLQQQQHLHPNHPHFQKQTRQVAGPPTFSSLGSVPVQMAVSGDDEGLSYGLSGTAMIEPHSAATTSTTTEEQKSSSNSSGNPTMKKWMTKAVISAGYVVEAVVSEGSFGTVLKAQRAKDSEYVALKAVPKARLSDTDCGTIRKQAYALRGMKHRYIVDFYDDFEDEHYFYHVFEYLHGGDLYERLEDRGKPYSEAQVLFLARQILHSVSYLHSKHASHRDIKLENFVFETNPKDERQIMKLIDFDLLIIRNRQSPRSETCTDMCGTILYVSPEIASGREHIPEESDMWACGVMLYVLLAYQMPFQGETGRQILRAVRTTEPYFDPSVWANISNGTKALVQDLLNKDAAQRPSAEQALERVKSIQFQARGQPHNNTTATSSSRLRALTKGLRSVSLNLWDPSGNLSRRGTGRYSDMRASAGSGSNRANLISQSYGHGPSNSQHGRISGSSGLLANGNGTGDWGISPNDLNVNNGPSVTTSRNGDWRGSGRNSANVVGDGIGGKYSHNNAGDLSNATKVHSKHGGIMGSGHGLGTGNNCILPRRRKGERNQSKSRRVRSQAGMVEVGKSGAVSPSASVMSTSGGSSSVLMPSDGTTSIGSGGGGGGPNDLDQTISETSSILNPPNQQQQNYGHINHHSLNKHMNNSNKANEDKGTGGDPNGLGIATTTADYLDDDSSRISDVGISSKKHAYAMDMDAETECMTSPALGGLVSNHSHRARSIMHDDKDEALKSGNIHTNKKLHHSKGRNGLRSSLGGAMHTNGNGRNDKGTYGHGHVDESNGNWFGDVAMLRGSRRLKKNNNNINNNGNDNSNNNISSSNGQQHQQQAHGLGARLRQLMHKSTAAQ